MRPRRAEVAGVEVPHLRNGVALEHGIGREEPAVWMVAIDRLHELLLRQRLRLAPRDGYLARLGGGDARQLALGKARVAQQVRLQAHHVRTAFGEHGASHLDAVVADEHAQLSAHPRDLLGDLRGRTGRCSLTHHLTRHVGQRHLAAPFVDVAGADDGVDGHLGDGAERDERDLHSVAEGDCALRRKGERLWCAERWRGLTPRLLGARRQGRYERSGHDERRADSDEHSHGSSPRLPGAGGGLRCRHNEYDGAIGRTEVLLRRAHQQRRRHLGESPLELVDALGIVVEQRE